MMLSFLLLSTLCFASSSFASFYVSLNGSDSSDGSQTSPFATLSRAQDAVRDVNSDLTSDLYVYVSAGTYYLEEPLNFTAVDSGSNGHRIIWQGEAGHGGVNISGGIQLTNWKVHDQGKGIWVANTPIVLESRHFYIDQTHGQRARQSFNRSWLTNVTEGYQVVNKGANFLLTTPGIEHGEIRGINSFTDRYIPIDSVVSTPLTSSAYSAGLPTQPCMRVRDLVNLRY